MENVDNESSSSWNEKSDQHDALSKSRSWWRRRRVVISAALMLLIISLALGLGLGLGLGLRDDEAATDVVVDLGYSQYRGKTFNDGTSQWLGMRYAAAPLGQLRFDAPRSPPSTRNVQPAVAKGPRCLSTHSKVTGRPIPDGQSEDCLFADVYAPANADKNSNLPVYLFIQGGGFNENTGSNNGRALIRASNLSIVIVTFNYRVGPFGFLASKEVQKNGSLNNGLKDQRQMLFWIQRHIRQFGGDPGHVVMGGASAGAASVTLQSIAYGGRNDGLFHAVAAESQSFAALRTVSESQYQYDQLVDRTGCNAERTGNNNTLDCLRGLKIATLDKYNIKTQFPGATELPLFAYNPTLDFDFIQDYPLNMFESGRFVKVPAIYGDDTDEGTVFVPRDVQTAQDSKDWIKAQFPDITSTQLNRLVQLYPATNPFPNTGKFWRATSTAYGELRYICPGIFMSRISTQHGITNNFNYRYNVEDPNTIRNGNGVPHVAETSAIWGTNLPKSYQPGGPNAHISNLMQKYWISFIISFDPNSARDPQSPVWESWTASRGERTGLKRLLIQGGTKKSVMEDVSSAQRTRCDVLASWGVALKQ